VAAAARRRCTAPNPAYVDTNVRPLHPTSIANANGAWQGPPYRSPADQSGLGGLFYELFERNQQTAARRSSTRSPAVPAPDKVRDVLRDVHGHDAGDR